MLFLRDISCVISMGSLFILYYSFMRLDSKGPFLERYKNPGFKKFFNTVAKIFAISTLILLITLIYEKMAK